jgi:putative aldouronate transport system substrate-binding protein
MAAQGSNNFNVTGMAITTACKNPDMIAAFFDYMTSPGAETLRWWGQEGTDYTIDPSTGYLTFNTDVFNGLNNDYNNYTTTSGIQLYTNSSGEYLGAPPYLTFPSGQDFTPPNANAPTGWTDVDKATFAAYGVSDMIDFFPDFSKIPSQEYGSIGTLPYGKTDTNAAILQSIKSSYAPGIASMVTCTTDQFEAAWTAWVNTQTTIGYQSLLDELNASLQDRITLWGLPPLDTSGN